MRGRKRFVLVALLAATASGFALPAAAVQVVAGAKGGYTLTDLIGENDEGANSKNSGLVGFILGWEINSWFSAHLEPVWTQKGAELENFQFGELASKITLDYFEIPVLGRFRYPLPETKKQGPVGVVGPVLGINTKANVTLAGGDQNITEFVHDVDFGFVVGAGYDLAIGTGTTTIEVRYVVGLSEVFESNSPSPQFTGNLRNGALQVTVGWFKTFF